MNKTKKDIDFDDYIAKKTKDINDKKDVLK